jgi:hypothetical protein
VRQVVVIAPLNSFAEMHAKTLRLPSFMPSRWHIFCSRYLNQVSMTKADYFLGHGRESIWLGFVGSHGRPETLNRAIRCAASGEAFRREVGAMPRTLPQGVWPELGWPWQFPTSERTHYTYAFDDGEIFVSVSGGPWFHLRPWQKEQGVEKPRQLQPKTLLLNRRPTRRRGIFDAGTVPMPLREPRPNGDWADGFKLKMESTASTASAQVWTR